MSINVTFVMLAYGAGVAIGFLVCWGMTKDRQRADAVRVSEALSMATALRDELDNRLTLRDGVVFPLRRPS